MSSEAQLSSECLDSHAVNTFQALRPLIPGIVDDRATIADPDVVTQVAADHEHVPIADPGGAGALAGASMHGHELAEDVAIADLLVEEGPLYTALHRLEKKRWLEGEWGYSDNNRRAKYYKLSRSGRQQLRAEVSAWERYARAVDRVLGTV